MLPKEALACLCFISEFSLRSTKLLNAHLDVSRYLFAHERCRRGESRGPNRSQVSIAEQAELREEFPHYRATTFSLYFLDICVRETYENGEVEAQCAFRSLEE